MSDEADDILSQLANELFMPGERERATAKAMAALLNLWTDFLNAPDGTQEEAKAMNVFLANMLKIISLPQAAAEMIQALVAYAAALQNGQSPTAWMESLDIYPGDIDGRIRWGVPRND